MSRCKSKLTLLVGVSAALLAFGASPASAVDFPHQESSAKWAGVEAADWNGSAVNARHCGQAEADCTFEVTGTILEHIEMWGMKLWSTSYECEMEGDIVSKDGTVLLTNSDCGSISDDAEGQICRHEFTNEFWLRMQVADFIGTGPLPLFAHLAMEPSELGSSEPSYFLRGAVLGDPDYGATVGVWGNDGSSYSIFIASEFSEMWDAQEILVGEEEGAELVCDWPELS